MATECIPQRGGRKTPERAAHEKSRAFRRGQRFRAGIEGRISVLFRGRGMKRCLLHGRERFEIFVGLAVLANNLLVLADLLTRRARAHDGAPRSALPRPYGAQDPRPTSRRSAPALAVRALQPHTCLFAPFENRPYIFLPGHRLLASLAFATLQVFRHRN